MSGKNFNAQLLFQFNNRFGNSGLGGVQGLCCFGQVQVVPYCFLDKAKLVKVHN